MQLYFLLYKLNFDHMIELGKANYKSPSSCTKSEGYTFSSFQSHAQADVLIFIGSPFRGSSDNVVQF